ncbi:3-deoxy-D-manno-octulosonic acid transferase [Yoonia sp. 208BN28-4]|uniref:3-deoxy-D-manno-octulosonic acid transferase n=1 Tax=Yoonia sp. 208BN28-4 TaxID=3126505 RepID=UPI0030A25F71
MTEFPTRRLRWFYPLYTLLWVIILPFALAYLWWRGRKDPLYSAHLGERFGSYDSHLRDAIWVHGVSLGELRSAVPLIRLLLDDGEMVVTTHFTPTGRREAQRSFAKEIADGRLQAVWIPLEFQWCFVRFFQAFRPKYGLVMEIEIWPTMIRAAHKHGIPLCVCNAQYPRKSFERDRQRSRWRFDLMAGFAGGFVKSDLQRDRFAEAGMRNIHVTGELRFDQAIPRDHVLAGEALKKTIARRTITITSVVAGEDETFIPMIAALQGPDAPLFIYVPRAPERFDETYIRLTDAGLKVKRRSTDLPADLGAATIIDADVLLGDSMGEMYFYLALCDQAVIGGSFVPKGAHNISEPLALSKPVVCGPHTWTIEFPFVEALAAGAAAQVDDADALTQYLRSGKTPSAHTVSSFFATQEGAVDRTYQAIKVATATVPAKN